MIKHINKVYKQATPYHHAYGKSWYRTAREICETLSERHNVPLYRVCGVMSALSPRNKWERNIIDCESLVSNLKDAKFATFGANVRKARKIMLANNSVEVLKLLNGSKTMSFYKNIYNKHSNAVTIDVWALRVAGITKPSLTPKQYKETANAFREVAAMHNLVPSELQAITWAVLREGI